MLLMIPAYLYVQNLFPGMGAVWLDYVKNGILLLFLSGMLYALMYLFRSSILALLLPAAYYLSHAMGLHFVPEWLNLYTGKAVPTLPGLALPMAVCTAAGVILFIFGEKEERQYKYRRQTEKGMHRGCAFLFCAYRA